MSTGGSITVVNLKLKMPRMEALKQSQDRLSHKKALICLVSRMTRSKLGRGEREMSTISEHLRLTPSINGLPLSMTGRLGQRTISSTTLLFQRRLNINTSLVTGTQSKIIRVPGIDTNIIESLLLRKQARKRIEQIYIHKKDIMPSRSKTIMTFQVSK